MANGIGVTMKIVRRQVLLVTALTVAECVSPVTARSPVLAAASQGDTPYAATRLIGRWRALMNTTLEESRAFAAEPVAELMEIFVSPGAVRLIQDKATDEQVEKIDAVVERFVLAAVRAGHRQPDGSTIVEEAAIESAQAAICPVYPFCTP
jgi:hypothetical protein